MQVAMNRMAMFKRNVRRDCPSCGSDDYDTLVCGSDVCTDCGTIVPGGSNISKDPIGFGGDECTAVPPLDPIVGSSPIRRIREWHPACERAAIAFARELDPQFTKGMSAAERLRHTQVLAYLAYRDDAQTSVTIARLAAQIHVPAERLSKDVKAVSARLGIRGWAAEDHEEDDDAEFARAVLATLKPGYVIRGVTVRTVTKWCRDLFKRALSAGEVQFANMPPRHQADAVLAVYCESVAYPFVNGTFGPPKRARTGAVESEVATAVRALTRSAPARRAMDSLRKYVTS